jgi:ribosomal protein S18 acetylase RimI-like enzyme
VDSAHPFGPGAAQELCQNGFGLVVESVRCCNGTHLARSHQFAEPRVPKPARGLFDGLGRLSSNPIRGGKGSGVHLLGVKRQFQTTGKPANELPILVRLGSAQPVVQMGDAQHQPQFPAPARQRAQQRHRVRAARDANPKTEPRLQISQFERQHWLFGIGHETMIRRRRDCQSILRSPRRPHRPGPYTEAMLQTRKALAEDAGLIAAHRKAMFAAMGGTEDSVLETMRQSCEPWLRRMIAGGKYVGWIISDGGAPVASAGLLLLDWPPHPLDPKGEIRAYLLNVFVESAYRRRGLARQLTETCIEEAHRLGIRVITLHASDAGRPVYDQLGFRPTNEMMRPDAGLAS